MRRNLATPRRVPLIWLVALCVGAPPSLTAQEPGLHDRFAAAIAAARDELIAVRRDLHRHPEVSGEERRTSGVVAERLGRLGLDVRAGVGGYGVIATLTGGKPGPAVGFRADMDAVYSDAPDPVDFASLTPGVRHICGHDIHTTVGLALATGFAAIRDDLPGSLVFFFQPAEERATGARAMVADGALDGLDLAAIYAFHTAPLEVGQLATRPGKMMASRDRVSVRVTGEGELQAVAAAVRQALVDVGTVSASQAVAPSADADFVFSQVGAPVASETGWDLNGVVTTATSTASARAKAQLDERVRELGGAGARIEAEYIERWVAGVDNDEELTRMAITSAERVLGPGSVVSSGDVVPAFSEDFGSFQERVPGVMFFLGVSNAEEGLVGMPHTPDYVADEASISVGARAMGAILLDALGRS